MHNSFLTQNIAQAANLLEKGNVDRAINVFNVLSSKFPKNSEVFHLKAYAYLQSKNIDKAKENFERAISISPEDCNIVLDYSNFLNSIGEKKLSLAKISNLTGSNKADYRLFYLQGCIHMDLKNHEDSIKSFKNVLQMKPDHKDASFNLGVIHFKTKKYELAEKIFRLEAPVLIDSSGFLREGSSHYQFIVTRWILEVAFFSKKSTDVSFSNYLNEYAYKMICNCYNFLVISNQRELTMPYIGDISPDFAPDWLLFLPFSDLARQYVGLENHDDFRISSPSWNNLIKLDDTSKEFMTKKTHQSFMNLSKSGWYKQSFKEQTIFFRCDAEAKLIPGHFHNDLLHFSY